MKKLLLFLAIALPASILFGQPLKKVIYKSQVVEKNGLVITIENAVSTDHTIKFKLVIKNNTSDYVVFKPNESVLTISGKDHNPSEKWLAIRPNDKETVIINLDGAGYMVTENFDYLLDGLYSVSSSTQANVCPNTLVSPSATMASGGFTCSADKFYKKATARTDIKFNCSYNGSKVGIYEPNRVMMKMKDKTEHKNYHSDFSPLVFAKGDTKGFMCTWKDILTSSGDMKTDDMTIIWHDAFIEADLKKIPAQKYTILYDEDATKAKK